MMTDTPARATAGEGAVEGGPPEARLLIVDDEPLLLRAIAKLFRNTPWEVRTAGGGREALAIVDSEPVDVVLLDVKMPDLSGTEVLDRIKRSHPDVEVVMMTAYGTIQTAVDAIRAGAYDFLTKPFEPIEQVARVVERAAEHKRLRDRNRFLESRLDLHEDYFGIVGSSPAMRRMFDVIEAVRQASSSVLIEGESGTGKELVARALHHGSPRRNRRFVAVNCSALPENLLESELFGHVRGAFTGAVQAREGLFERAHGGTLFLDEIGDMPTSLQVKLLRVLQEGEIRRVGESEPRAVDVRILAATHQDLREAMEEGRFREDLYYRLNVITIEAPPLRERVEDVPLLAHHFLQVHAARNGKEIEGIEPEVLTALSAYHWPGNVRELENVVERAVVLCRGQTIDASTLPEHVRAGGGGTERADVSSGRVSGLPFRQAKDVAVQTFERRYLREVLDRAEGNISEAARLAGLDRSNFRRLMKRHSESFPPS
ncbi:MAG: sigma-54-dependent transcriptional regulator [Myxococcota bacterium]